MNRRRGAPAVGLVTMIGVASLVPAALPFPRPSVALAQVRDLPSVSVVASIKPSVDNEPGMIIRRTPPGMYSAVKVTAATLLTAAFNVTFDRLLGLPEQSTRFDIDARAVTEAGTPPSTAAVLQSVLRERFGLVAHVEQREFPVYVLKLSRPDGRLGPRLSRASMNCADAASAAAALNSNSRAANGAPACGALEGPEGFIASGVTMDILARALRPPTGRPVVNATGLTGAWDVQLEFAPLGDAVGEKPNVFTAVKESLGLELVPGTSNLDVLVVDAIHDPTPN